MHEQSLINDLIKKILSLAEREKARKVTKVSVKLGALSHMSAPHFKEHYDIAAKGTIAENAIIEAEESSDIDDPHAQAVILKSIDVQ
jgi:hydrogenase nickel incorporation protein HypA/HybF